MSELDFVQKITILGGGTASGLVANFLASYGKKINRFFDITVIDNPDTKPIGVGEATSEILTLFMEEFCHFTPLEFMRNTDAVFKHGIQFKNWSKGCGEHYWNPLYQRYGELKVENPDLNFLRSLITNFNTFSETYMSTELMERGLSPFDKNDKKIVTYAMHFDSYKAAQYLRDEAIKLGVKYRDIKITDIIFDNEQNATGVKLSNNEVVESDFIIDCMGFSSLFNKKNQSGEFVDCSDKIICDKALVANFEYTEKEKEIFYYTKAEAKENGWMWTIPMWSKASSAYVYASEFITEEEAKETLINYHPDKELFNFKTIPFRTGYFSKTFRKTSMSLGLSSNFFEPLESTSILLQIFIINSLKDIIDGNLSIEAANKKQIDYYNEVLDFLFLHYFLSQRRDSSFWKKVTQKDFTYSRVEKTFQKFKNFNKDNSAAFKVIRETKINPNFYFAVFDGLGQYDEDKQDYISLSDLYDINREQVDSLPTAFEYLKKVHNEI